MESEENSSEEATVRNFTEYEIALLWTQFKDNFPQGRVNKIQLGQMLRSVSHNLGYDFWE